MSSEVLRPTDVVVINSKAPGLQDHIKKLESPTERKAAVTARYTVIYADKEVVRVEANGHSFPIRHSDAMIISQRR